MKKKILVCTLIFYVCLFMCACSDNGNKDEESVISKMSIYNAEGNYEGEIHYDDYGNSIKTTLVDANGIVTTSSETSYKYDLNGNYIIRTYKSDTSSFVEEYTYQYDEQGNIISCEVLKDGKDMGDYVYYNGKLKVHTMYDDNGNVQSVHEYEYDEAGNIIKEFVINKDMNSEDTIEYSYDEHNYSTGYEITSKRVDAIAVITVAYENEYDTDGRLVKRSKYNVENGKKIFTGIEEREYYD